MQGAGEVMNAATEVMNAATLPEPRTPNRDGFIIRFPDRI